MLPCVYIDGRFALSLTGKQEGCELMSFSFNKDSSEGGGEMCRERCVTKTVSIYFFHINKGTAHASERRASMLSGCSINERAHCALKAGASGLFPLMYSRREQCL